MNGNDSKFCSNRWVVWIAILGMIIAFGIAHTQSPLYFSNQHQYFLHGLANGGDGYLDQDWLANTLDPTPVFSALVEFSYRHLDLFVIHIVFFALLGTYFVSLLAICSALVPEGPGRPRTLLAAGIGLIVVHAAAVRWASVLLTGVDYPWYFQCGVAGQYVLGPGLQPSTFGVLLLASVAAFVHDRPVLAIACSSAACLVHATYLLPAAFLTLAYMLQLWRSGRVRAGLCLGAGALLLVSPTIVYSAQTFGPTSPETFREAQRVFVEVRIPHHAMILRWFDLVAGLQVAWIALALLLARRSRLLIVLGIPALLSLAVTLIQFESGSRLLALLFPWRLSAILVPAATAIVLSRLAMILPSMRYAPAIWISVGLTVLASGIWVQAAGIGYGTNQQELGALDFVREHKQPGDLCLIPVRVPSAGSAPRGVISTTFTPPPGGKDKHLIAVDLQRFRLYTGAPIYIDFKSMPYKDVDVLEWLRRIDRCRKWYAGDDWNSRKTLGELRDEKITCVLIQADKPIDGEAYELVYADRYYRIYRLRGKSGG